jgi:hypothetical protein
VAKIVKNIWMWISVGDLETELLQAEQEGREIAELRPRFRRLMRLGDEALFQEKNQRKAAQLLDLVQQAKLRRDYPYDEAVAKIHSRWDERRQHDCCHTNSDAMICAAALLYGEGDFGTSICRAVARRGAGSRRMTVKRLLGSDRTEAVNPAG